jgi:hypothetical protein
MKTLANLKELHEKDFYQWIIENLELLKNKDFDLADWENLLEEIEDIRKPENCHLAKKYFDKLPTEQDFPKKCPYVFQQILEYEAWLENNT